MPLTRYQIRNEYGLADPELYKTADKDDPEALLEGVAMAALVGVLRQLGDLAQFAAEIFHDLHEEVMTTAARGHGLMSRVQQLEAEFPSIEKACLSQTNHSSFFSTAGVDWHPNLRMEQSLITRGDLPRFVMDSYEECRGPPRLFLLDKFDVAGAGACLKRYTDPSFFKVEAAASGMATLGVQREKKIRKVKKKGSRWRNGDTPEVVPTSHAKLHELFLEERVENGHPDPARLVKLKRRQLNGSQFDVRTGKSYMEKFLQSPSPEHKLVHEIYATPLLLKLTPDHSAESALEVLDISMVSPGKKSSPGEERTLVAPNAQEIIVKAISDESNGEAIDRRIVKVSDPSVDGGSDESPSIIHRIKIEEELAVDVDDKSQGSLNGNHSDNMASEVDNYMDALATMETEIETDSECKNDQGFLNFEKRRVDSDAVGEQPDVESNFSDTQSIGIYSVSDDGNSSSKKGRSSSSYAGSLSTLAESMPPEGERTGKVPSIGICLDEVVNLSSDSPSVRVESLGSKCHELVVPNDTCAKEDRIPDPGEASRGSCLEDSNPMLQPSAPEANSMISLGRPDLEDTPFDSVESDSMSPDIDKRGANLDDSPLIMPGVPSQTGNGISFAVSSESHPADESDHEDLEISSEGTAHSSNMLELGLENKGIIDSVIASENCAENFVEVNKGTSVSSLLDSLEVVQPTDLVSEVDDAIAGMTGSPKNLMVDTSETDSIKGHKCSTLVADISQVQVDSAEEGSPYFEEKKFEEISDSTTSEEMVGSIGTVNYVEGDAVSHEHSSDYSHKVGLENDVSIADLATETVQTKDVAALALVFAGSDDSINDIISPSLDLTSCSSKNLEDMQESFSHCEDTHQIMLDLHEANSSECLAESEAQNEVEVAPTNLGSVLDASISFSPEENSPECLAESEAQKEVEQVEVAPTNLGSVLDASNSDGHVNQDATEPRVLDLQEENSPECLAESEAQKEVEQVEVAPTNLGFFLDASISDGHANQDATELRVVDLQEENSPECLAESEAQKEVEQGEVAPTNLGPVLDASISDGHSNQGVTERVLNSPLVGQAQTGSCVNDTTTELSSEEIQEVQPTPTYQIPSVGNSEGDPCSPTSCIHELGTSLLKSVVQADQIEEQSVHPFTDEAIPNLLNLQNSPTCQLAEPRIPLGQMSELQYDQLDRRCLHADKVNSLSTNLQSEQDQSVCHIGHESSILTSASVPEDLSDQELLLQPTGPEFTGTGLARSQFDSPFPTFGLVPEATQVNLEEIPPLPPLPPVQWRIGKIQPTPLAAQRELIDHSQVRVQPVLPFTSESKAQFDIPSFNDEIVESSNPFLSTNFADSQRSQLSSPDLVGSSLLSTPLLLDMPNVIDANSQQEGIPLEGTQSLNPFLISAEILNEKRVHGSLALGGDSVQSSSNSFSLAPSTEHTTPGQDPLSSQGPPMEPLNELATETALEVKLHEHPSQILEGEQENLFDRPVVSLSTIGEQREQHGLVTSPEATAWSPGPTLALPPTYEVGKLNGNKLPRPRNPLIDAVAAHDKSKLRKVTERVPPQIGPKVEERDSLLEQIRTKSFNLKPATVTRPSVQGPKTNLKVSAILEKANAIRQALAGSDEEDDSDSWSDS